MKAKPRKCVSFAMKQFDKRIKNETFEPFFKTIYTAFDPKLTIAGQAIRAILNRDEPDKFKAEHFKFLGRYIHVSLLEHELKKHIRKLFEDDLAAIDVSKINGFMKAWLYQFHVLAHLTWAFLVHDLDRSFANDLNCFATQRLKFWIGLYKTADPGVSIAQRTTLVLDLQVSWITSNEFKS